MKRRLLAALAGCLTLPAFGWAQSDGNTIPNAPIYPTARPNKPITATPQKPVTPYYTVSPYNAQPVSPYNAQPTTRYFNPPVAPAPVEPPIIEYPSQPKPTPLPKDVAPQSQPIWNTPTLGNPQPTSSTSFKNPTELQEAPKLPEKTPVGITAEPKPPAPKQTAPTMIPDMNPTIAAPVPVAESKPKSSLTSPTPAPTSYPGTKAEAIIKYPTQACINGQCGNLASIPGCNPCDPPACGPYGRAWLGAEYLYFTSKGSSVPPLVTTSPAGTSLANAGVLGTPGVRTLFGGQTINNGWRSGFRIYGGYWLDQAQTLGVDFSGFYLGQSTSDFSATSPGSPILSRPFFNAATGMQAAELVAFPGVLAGTVGVSSGSNVYGLSPNLRYNLCCDCDSRIDLLFGYRYLRLRDGITIREDLIATDPAGVRAPFGTRITVVDTFNTVNTFNGAQIGLAGEQRFGDFFISGRMTVAAGNTHTQVDINGQTQIRAVDGTRTNLVGGLLAQRSNIGSYSFDSFSVIPEVGLNLGMQVNQNLRVFAGYTFLYWNNVSRAAEQIDTGVNPTAIPRAVPPSALQGTPRPAFFNRDSDYFLHGVSAGVELRF